MIQVLMERLRPGPDGRCWTQVQPPLRFGVEPGGWVWAMNDCFLYEQISHAMRSQPENRAGDLARVEAMHVSDYMNLGMRYSRN